MFPRQNILQSPVLNPEPSAFASLYKIIYEATQRFDLDKLVDLYEAGVNVGKIVNGYYQTIRAQLFLEADEIPELSAEDIKFFKSTINFQFYDGRKKLKRITDPAIFFVALVDYCLNCIPHSVYDPVAQLGRDNGERLARWLPLSFEKDQLELIIFAAIHAGKFDLLDQLLGEDHQLVKAYVIARYFEKAANMLTLPNSERYSLAAEGYAYLGMEDKVKELSQDSDVVNILYEYAHGGHSAPVNYWLNQCDLTQNIHHVLNIILRGYIAGGYFHKMEELLQRGADCSVAIAAFEATDSFDFTKMNAVVRVLSYINSSELRVTLGNLLYPARDNTGRALEKKQADLKNIVLPRATLLNNQMQRKKLSYDELDNAIYQMRQDKLLDYEDALEMLEFSQETVNLLIIFLLQGLHQSQCKLNVDCLLYVISFIGPDLSVKSNSWYIMDGFDYLTINTNKLIFNLYAGHYVKPFFANLLNRNRRFDEYNPLTIIPIESQTETTNVSVIVSAEDAEELDYYNRKEFRVKFKGPCAFNEIQKLTSQLQDERFFSRKHVIRLVEETTIVSTRAKL